MKKIIIMLGVSLVIIIALPVYAVTQVYDSDREIFYVGGYVFTHAQKILKEKPSARFDKKIYEIKLKKPESKTFIQTKDDIVFFELSNKGYLAVSTWREVFLENNKTQLNTYLSIYDGNGKLIKTIDNVPVITRWKRFSWSPDGTKIAFIRGKMISESNVPFEPMGVWMYDIKKDELKKISDFGWDVRWARYDNNVHILKYIVGPTYVYDMSTEKLTEKKEGKGIIFSLDGKHYVGITLEPGDMEDKDVYHVYDGNSDDSVYTFEDGFWGHTRFIDNKYLLIWNINWGYKIFDVIKKEKIRLGRMNRMLGWNKDMTKVVVYEGGDKIHIDELLTGTRWQSIDIPGK